MDPFLKPSGGERLLANVGYAGARDVRVPDEPDPEHLMRIRRADLERH